jgi:Family of unknown function (DUF5681)
MSEHNNNNNNNRRADAAPAPTETPEPEYKVGPGRPPKEYRFKPGQSGNPKGLKRKPKPMAPDLKAALERALNEPIKLKQGERERTMTMAEAGIKQLVAQFVKGNHQARRDLIVLADKLGVDLMAGQQQALQEGVAANHEAILNAYVDRQYDRAVTRAPVIAPPELLDDDPQDQKQD